MRKIKSISLLLLFGLIWTSCVNDLDTVPIDPDEATTADLYNSLNGYRSVLAKLYGGLSVTGQDGPAGQGDIAGIDEGFSSYYRTFFKHQELPTEEAVIAWNDQTIKDFHDQDWTADDNFIFAMYSRIYYQLTLANEFIRASSEGNIGGFSEADKTTLRLYRAEARFLRAFSYTHAMDLFANVPFVDENDGIGAFFPEQIQRADLFEFIESELLAIESELAEPMQNEYARVDRAAAWVLLAKNYLNAEVYTGTARYTDCIEYCNKVINAGYSLYNTEATYTDSDGNEATFTPYEQLFMADNHRLTSEIIFPVAFDGLRSQSFGGMTFIINASIGGSYPPERSGMGGGWGGTRATSKMVDYFQDGDSRAMFYTDGQNKEITDIGSFTDGYMVVKFKNVNSDGSSGSNPTHPDTDFPVFRLSDIYLMYAEAVLRNGAGGDRGTAVNYINQIRTRAFGDESGNITDTDLSLPFIFEERSRELYWECHRRTDMVRFGRFSQTDYTWPWKGGVETGQSVDPKFDIYPIPNADLAANPNLTQNPGY